jgi:hypothetical protein
VCVACLLSPAINLMKTGRRLLIINPLISLQIAIGQVADKIGPVNSFFLALLIGGWVLA